MTAREQVHCLIPARGGSRGIPGKNLRPLAGRPLLYYILQAAQECPAVGRIWVSTEDAAIRDFALRQGAEVIDRPAELAGDEATSETALVHALSSRPDDFRPEDIVVFAQATSPLTRPGDLGRLVDRLREGYDSAAFFVPDYGHFFDFDDMMRVRLPRQMRTPRRREAGNAWAFRAGEFLRRQSRLYGRIGLVEIPPPRDREVDTEDDFRLVEYFMNAAAAERKESAHESPSGETLRR